MKSLIEYKIVKSKKYNKQYRKLKFNLHDENIINNVIEKLSHRDFTGLDIRDKLKGLKDKSGHLHILGTYLKDNLILVYKYQNKELILELLEIGKHDIIDSYIKPKRRRYLKEELGQSTSLDLFVNQLINGTYNPFWRITLKSNGRIQNNYFSIEDGAKNYYNMILKSFKENPEDFKDAEVSLTKISIPDIIIDNEENDININEEDIGEDKIGDIEL